MLRARGPYSFSMRLRGRKRYIVEDWSMAPTLVPGDAVVVDLECLHKRLPEVGEVVVLTDPEGSGRKLVKRVERVETTPEGVQFYVAGDNGLWSRDSRHFGPIGRERLLGVVTPTPPNLG